MSRKVVASIGVVLGSELYRGRNKSRDSWAAGRHEVGCGRNRMASWKRSAGGSNGDGRSSWNTGLREEGYATNDDRSIRTRDVGMYIGTGGSVSDLGLEVLLLLCHGEVFAGCVELALMKLAQIKAQRRR